MHGFIYQANTGAGVRGEHRQDLHGTNMTEQSHICQSRSVAAERGEHRQDLDKEQDEVFRGRGLGFGIGGSEVGGQA